MSGHGIKVPEGDT